MGDSECGDFGALLGPVASGRNGLTSLVVAWMIPGEVALFGPDELDAAKQWAAG